MVMLIWNTPISNVNIHKLEMAFPQETALKPKAPRLGKVCKDLGIGQVLRFAFCESIHIVESHPKIMLVIVTFNVTNVRGAKRVGEFEQGVINR